MTALDDAISTASAQAGGSANQPATMVDPGTGATMELDPQYGVWMPQLSAADKLNQAVLDASRQATLQGANTSQSAPVDVRAAVGAAATPEDRLSILRQWYPDAQPVPGGNNFVYTDPATQQKQTYERESGWPTWRSVAGSVASAGPEIAEGVGGTAGAIGGAFAGGPVGGAVGGGLGATAAKEGYRAGIISLLAPQGDVDSRSTGQVAANLGTTFALNAVMPWLGARVFGPIVSSVAEPLLGASKTTTAAAADALKASTGVDVPSALPAGVIGESVPVQRAEQLTGGAVLGGGVKEQYQAGQDAMNDAASKIATKAAGGATPPTPDSFAGTVNDIARRVNDGFETNRAQLDQNVENLVGANTPMNLNGLRALKNQYQTELAAAPNTLGPRYQPAIDAIDKLLTDADAQGGTLPFSVLRNARTDLGTQVGWNQNTTATDAIGMPLLKQVYGAEKNIINNAAASAGPNAQQALQLHDAAVTAYRDPDNLGAGGPAAAFQKLMQPNLDANAVTKLAQSNRPADQVTLASLFSPSYTTAAERDTLRGGLLNQMGTAKDGDFDMPTWLNNYDKMNDPAKNMLFGSRGAPGGLQDDLANLETVQRQFQGAAGYRNFPNTASGIQFFNTLGSSLSELMRGAPVSAAGQLASGFGGPFGAGRLMTSQPFVRWMSGAYALDPSNAAQVASYIGRLGAVGEADPAIADFTNNLRHRLVDSQAAPPP